MRPLLAALLALLPVHAAAAPVDLEAAHLAAEAATRAGDYRAAADRYRAILAELETLPAPEAPEPEWVRAWLGLAVVTSTLGQADASRAAMDRVLALDPAARLDPDHFSPVFRKEFEAARTRDASRPRFQLRVTTPDGSGRGWVQGRPLDPLPAGIRLPPSRYRVGVESGGRVRTVSIDLARDETVTLDPSAPSLAAAPPPASSAPASAPTSGGGGWIRPTAWTASGLAVVAAGLATWQGIAAAGSYADASGMLLPDGSLRPGVDPAAYAASAADYQAERRNAFIAGGAAVVLGAGAIVLFVLAPGVPVEPAPGGVALRF